jgi:phosphatidylglycerophosphate synthase
MLMFNLIMFIGLTMHFLVCFSYFYMLLSFLPPTTFYMEGPWAAMATTCIFLAAAVTDWLDGYIARKVCQKIFFLNYMLDWVVF